VSRAINTIYLQILPLVAIFCSYVMADDGASKPVSFIREVAPVLVARCQACHGPKTMESNYRLDTFELMMKPGDFGVAPIMAGDLENSQLYQLITAKDVHERMPNNGGQLDDTDIQTIARWILQGARFDGQSASAPLRDQIPRDLRQRVAPATYTAAIPITAMTYISGNSQLLVGGYHELLVWDPAHAKLVARIGNISQRSFGLACSPDKIWLAVAGGSPGVSGEVRLIRWDEKNKAKADSKVLATSDDVFFDVAFAPNGKQLAAAAADGSVRIIDTSSGAERLRINNHADWVTDICFSPDSRLIATASRDKTAKVFNADSGTLLATYSQHKVPVRAVTFAPDGKSVISAGGSQVHVWNLDSKLLGEMTGCEGEVYALLTCGNSVVAASADRKARQFKLKDRTIVRALAHPEAIMSLAWDEATHRLSTGCFNGTVTIWDLENGKIIKQFLAFPMAAKPH
jgi:hypothetical protein